MQRGGGTIPTDPNARRDQKLEAILGSVNKTNKLLEAQNKILEKMERHGRPIGFTNHPYLERTDSGTGSGASPEEGGLRSPGALQGGDPTSSR